MSGITAGKPECFAALALAGLLLAAVMWLAVPTARRGSGATGLNALPPAARSVVLREIRSGGHGFALYKARSGALEGYASGLSLAFRRGGVAVSGGSGVQLRLGLTSLGRGAQLRSIGATGSPVRRKDTVVFSRGDVIESFARGYKGIEQRFTLTRRPGGTGQLTLAVGKVATGERIRFNSGDGGLTVQDGADHGVIRYAGLRVMDARGRALPGRIERHGRTVVLRIDDHGARYPLRIDPTVELASLLPQDPNSSFGAASGDDEFGYAVAISGSTIVVGAPFHDVGTPSSFTSDVGSAYVFTDTASGWEPSSELTPPNQFGTAFGQAVALSGTTIAVAAPVYPGGQGQGTVYMFTESSGQWSQAAALTPTDGMNLDHFGASIFLSGNTLVVGAPAHQVGAKTNQGAAYVFTTNTGWHSVTQAELTASDGAANDAFGTSVAYDPGTGTTVVGAPDATVGSNSAQGAVYVYTASSGQWSQTAKLTVSDGHASDNFGQSLAVSSGTVVAGAPNWTGIGAQLQGVVYVFSGSGGNWQQSAELTASDPVQDARLGWAVDLSGSTLVAGEDLGCSNCGSGGAVYVFAEPQGGWRNGTQSSELKPVANTPWANSTNAWHFGSSVAADAGNIVVGSQYSGVENPLYGVSVFGSGGSQGPVNTVAPAIAGTAAQGQTLTDVHGTWTVTPSSYTYQWEDCNSSGLACTPISGATGQTYQANSSDVGSTIRVLENVNTPIGTGNATASPPTAVIQPPLPVNAAPPTISGNALQGQTLSETHGAWQNNPTRYTYQWQDCDASGNNCASIVGATAQTYTLTQADVGSTIRVVESAWNAGGAGAPAPSARTAVIQALTPPVEQQPPTIAGIAQQGQTLLESHGAWTEFPTNFTYQWESCSTSGTGCAAIPGATAPSYTLQSGDVGHEIVVVETAYNLDGPGSPASSVPTQVVVVPPPPVKIAAPTISGIPNQGQTLSEANGSWSNNPLSYTYQWKDCDSGGKNCSPIPGATGQTYGLTAADVGHTVVVAETAHNAGGASAPADSAPTGVVVQPPPPVNANVPTIFGTATVGQALIESHGAWSNNPLSYAYQWQDCDSGGGSCTSIAGANSQIYQVQPTDLGMTIRVQEVAINAGGPSSPASSLPTGTVAASVPVATQPPTIAGTASVGQTLVESHGQWSGNPSKYSYQWEDCDSSGQNCVAIPGATMQSYTLTSGELGHTVRVAEIASNAAGAGNPAPSAQTNQVLPVAPVNQQLPGISGSARVGSTLVEAHGVWSGSPIAYAYQWEDCDARGGNCVGIQGATQQTYTLTGSDAGHTLEVQETAANLGGQSTPSASGPSGLVLGPPVISVPARQSASGPSSAGLTATVDPEGLPTIAYYRYGLDPQYTGVSAVEYSSTATASLSGSFDSDPVTDTLSGLVANARYHVQLVAMNSAGTTTGPDQTFRTPSSTAAPPTAGQAIDIAPVSGIVMFKPAASQLAADTPVALQDVRAGFQPLTEIRHIPFGSVIDTRTGTLKLIVATGHGTQSALLTGALITITQTGRSRTTIALDEHAYPGAPSYAACSSARSSHALQTLAITTHGRFSVVSRSMTVVGQNATWRTTDQCNGTRTTVQHGTISLAGRHERTITLHARQSHLSR